ncbi:hypothetical protein F11_17855 [Rhodospirillum rubrum F11]|uniref:GDT1 family protein n=2 Tax=Rhodospirillum rubrum TaxID=1085 RepID=Q2RNL5_RHORT|nr:Protein of unknown function UPF0016 [Rhodospirillum rubrum ATCC 11170]AEO50031.1 hypothetical protein F11_17855 [Rhodospirillum rubrum F11]MBK5955999.1 UPF0016 family membrane protein [Rhodospirillum rubrum]QXG80208.1 TMEM165/GDT1 family protein [Rhodospirillum rubrum]
MESPLLQAFPNAVAAPTRIVIAFFLTPSDTAMQTLSALLPIFLTVFLAELGDKTQLATMLYASGGQSRPLAIFIAASAALVLSTALAVFVGAMMTRYVEALPLKLIAGVGFIVIGSWTVFQHYRGA